MYVYIRTCTCIDCTDVIEELQMIASPVKSTGAIPEDYEITSLPAIPLPKRKYSWHASCMYVCNHPTQQ